MLTVGGRYCAGRWTGGGAVRARAWEASAGQARRKAISSLVARGFSNDSDGDGALDPGETEVFGDGSARTLGRERLTDYGAYAQIAWGFQKGWVAALRGDYVTRDNRAAYELAFGDDADRDRRWRISPNLTWYPTEFSKVRLQYNFDHRQHLGPDHSIWLQWEFLLGAHSAHKF